MKLGHRILEHGLNGLITTITLSVLAVSGIVIGASSMKRKDTKSAYINNMLWRALSVTLQ